MYGHQNVIDRAKALGTELGPVVVVVVGYNDYEANFAENIDDAMAVFRNAGVPACPLGDASRGSTELTRT